MQQAKSLRAGFTVTELLVVIAILIVLAALVVASVGRAREAAYASVCMNNMKQVASEQLNLCNENNGVITHANRTQVKGIGPSRDWQLHHTILQSDELSWGSSASDVNEKVETEMEHLQCPTAYRLQRSEMDKLNGWQKVSTYAFNGIIGGDSDPDTTPGWIVGARYLSDIEYPSNLILAIEKEWASWDVYSNGAGALDRVHVFAEFHNGGFNVAFYDGHVERGIHGKFPIWTKDGFSYGSDEHKRYWWGRDSRIDR